MNRINRLFKSGRKNILSVYFTAGYPFLEATLPVIKELSDHNVDMIEIGIPFSDPVADGPVIQASSQKALKNGMNLRLLFEHLRDARKYTSIPLILMGYINPVHRFGMENFLAKCNETGIDGVIIPDLPAEEYREKYEKLFKQRGILNIFLVSPQTPDERVRWLASLSGGFLYVVSTSATTGVVDSFGPSQITYFERIRALDLKTPWLIGFGISNRNTFEQACEYTDGAIIGSRFVSALGETDDLSGSIRKFLDQVRK